MNILVDAMGGDFAPEEIIKGAVKAAPELSETISLIGPKDRIDKILSNLSYNGNNIKIIDASEVITNDESPAKAVVRKKDSTISKGMQLLKSGEVDVFISGGSTGALLAGGVLLLGTIEGVRKPAIAAWFPQLGGKNTTLLLDCGANAEAKPEHLEQYGIMGSIYTTCVKGIKKPVVRLLNVGSEDGKGNEMHKESFKLLQQAKINFCGNIEARDIIYGGTDIVVADGFSGNVFLKSSEGMSSAIMGQFKEKLTSGLLSKLGALLSYSKIQELRNEFKYYDVGGAPILGLLKPVLKIHGNSKETEVYYAILKSIDFVKGNVTNKIAKQISSERSFN